MLTGSVVSGGTFVGGSGGTGVNASGTGRNGPAGRSFSVQGTGTTLTLVGTFDGGPTTITSGTGTFTGTLANNAARASYTYNVSGGTIVLTSVPEPASLGLLVAGGALLARRRR